jgi:hypothetical protein
VAPRAAAAAARGWFRRHVCGRRAFDVGDQAAEDCRSGNAKIQRDKFCSSNKAKRFSGFRKQV